MELIGTEFTERTISSLRMTLASVWVNSTGGLLLFADEFVDVEFQNYRCGWSCDARLGVKGSIPWSKLGSGYT